jgi:hypothetical protein
MEQSWSSWCLPGGGRFWGRGLEVCESMDHVETYFRSRGGLQPMCVCLCVCVFYDWTHSLAPPSTHPPLAFAAFLLFFLKSPRSEAPPPPAWWALMSD